MNCTGEETVPPFAGLLTVTLANPGAENMARIKEIWKRVFILCALGIRMKSQLPVMTKTILIVSRRDYFGTRNQPSPCAAFCRYAMSGWKVNTLAQIIGAILQVLSRNMIAINKLNSVSQKPSILT